MWVHQTKLLGCVHAADFATGGKVELHMGGGVSLSEEVHIDTQYMEVQRASQVEA